MILTTADYHDLNQNQEMLVLGNNISFLMLLPNTRYPQNALRHSNHLHIIPLKPHLVLLPTVWLLWFECLRWLCSSPSPSRHLSRRNRPPLLSPAVSGGNDAGAYWMSEAVMRLCKNTTRPKSCCWPPVHRISAVSDHWFWRLTRSLLSTVVDHLPMID